MKFTWNIFSYIGLFFAVIYRIPQIIKIYKTKKADDLSSYSYLTHNGAYISFILYLYGTNKTDEWVLCSYYIMGIIQNLIIFCMKKYYMNNTNLVTV
jgi:uncharacterized protein with PQ loop repeat